jgi:uncharacterized protein YbcI
VRTPGEIEAAISEGISRFEQDCMGRCSRDIHAHLLGDLLSVRLQGVLTAAEQRLVRMRVTSDVAAASWRIVSRLCQRAEERQEAAVE